MTTPLVAATIAAAQAAAAIPSLEAQETALQILRDGIEHVIEVGKARTIPLEIEVDRIHYATEISLQSRR